MKLAFEIVPKLNSLQMNVIEELSYHTTKLYNIVNYDLTTKKYISYYEMNNEYKTNYHSSFLHSHTYQFCLKILDNNWKGYFNASSDYEKNPSKYLGKPRKPRYKNTDNKKNEVVFTNYAIRFRNNTLMLSLSKKMQEKFHVKSLEFVISDKLQSIVNFHALQQIRIKYDRVSKIWKIIAIYESKEKTLPEDYTNIVAVDVGLTNLATCVNLHNIDNIIVSGKALKSMNRYMNNKISKLQSIVTRKKQSNTFKNTKQIIRLNKYRKDYIKNYMHKAANKVIEYALKNKCFKIVIGDIQKIKQNMNYNKSFVQIPIQELVTKIEYKAKLKGIQVEKITEEYTSGCSSIDLEEISKKYYKKSRRIKRGLFRTNKGLIINADINGSLNILRKYIKGRSIPKLIQEAMDKGCTGNPVRSLIS